jgi:hypothetical protein
VNLKIQEEDLGSEKIEVDSNAIPDKDSCSKMKE